MDMNSSDDEVLDENFPNLLLYSDNDENDATNDDSEIEPLIVQDVSDCDSDNSTISTTHSTGSWRSDCESHNPWSFTEQTGPTEEVYLCEKPIDFYELFLSKELLNLIVVETNRQGNAKFKNFEETSAQEVKKFLGLCPIEMEG